MPESERESCRCNNNDDGDDDGDFLLNAPFFFAIVTTLREPEVEAAGDREGAAIVMRVPHTEDLRRADIGASRVGRGGKEKKKSCVRERERAKGEILHFFVVVVAIKIENKTEINKSGLALPGSLELPTGLHAAAAARGSSVSTHEARASLDDDKR